MGPKKPLTLTELHMIEMLPNLNDLPELDSVAVTEPLEAQTHHNNNQSSPRRSVSQHGFTFVCAFLKRNAFLVLTVGAVTLGK